MTTLTPDILTLCAAIDAGDDTALPILADALEDAGDSRAAGLRHLREAKMPAPPTVTGQPRPVACAPWRLFDVWAWTRERHDHASGRHASDVRPDVWGRLTGDEGQRRDDDGGAPVRRYPTRHAAFLALAQAIVETQSPRV